MKIPAALVLSLPALFGCLSLGLMLWDRPALLITSDTLLPAALVWDLRHGVDAWANFQHPRVPSFVPDLLVFGAVQGITDHWRLAMAVWVLVMIGGLTVIGGLITARLAPCAPRTAVPCVLSVLMVVLGAAALTGPEYVVQPNPDGVFFAFIVLIHAYTHGGPLLLMLVTALLIDRASQAMTGTRIAAITALSAVATASDLLSVPVLLVPATMALIGQAAVGRITASTVIRLAAAAWGGAALGLAAVSRLDRQAMPFPPIDVILLHIETFLRTIWTQPSAMVLIVGTAVLLVWDLARRGPRAWLAGFWPVFIGSSASGGFALMLLQYEDAWSWRYAQPALIAWLALTASWLVIRMRAAETLARRAIIVMSLGMVLIHVSTNPLVPAILTWETPLARCLRDAGLRAGLAQFWIARETSAATDWAVHVEQITARGAAFVWGNDRSWYTHDIHDRTRRPRFQFIVMRRLAESDIEAAYGRPDRVMTCQATPVWLYDDPDRLYQGLVRASPDLAPWFAKAPSR